MARVATEEVCCLGLSHFCDDASLGIYLVPLCLCLCTIYYTFKGDFYDAQTIFQVKKIAWMWYNAITCASLMFFFTDDDGSFLALLDICV